MTSEAYQAGRKARMDHKTVDDNPYLGEPSKVGIRRYTDETAGSDWSRGYRDERDAKAKQFPDIRLFRRKSNRYYSS